MLARGRKREGKFLGKNEQTNKHNVRGIRGKRKEGGGSPNYEQKSSYMGHSIKLEPAAKFTIRNRPGTARAQRYRRFRHGHLLIFPFSLFTCAWNTANTLALSMDVLDMYRCSNTIKLPPLLLNLLITRVHIMGYSWSAYNTVTDINTISISDNTIFPNTFVAAVNSRMWSRIWYTRPKYPLAWGGDIGTVGIPPPPGGIINGTSSICGEKYCSKTFKSRSPHPTGTGGDSWAA